MRTTSTNKYGPLRIYTQEDLDHRVKFLLDRSVNEAMNEPEWTVMARTIIKAAIRLGYYHTARRLTTILNAIERAR